MMKELPNLKYRRSVVPDDAVSLEVNTICCGDASKELACTAVYVRFKLRDGFVPMNIRLHQTVV